MTASVSLGDVTLIIPLAPQERAWIKLIDDLEALPRDTEIVFVAPLELDANVLNSFFKEASQKIRQLSVGRKVRMIQSLTGRSVQMNAGAQIAQKKFLFFLHADSRLSENAIDALEASIQKNPEALHYFDLEYENGTPLTLINTLGSWVGSHVLGLPTGRQGFCISRENFERVGKFDETLSVSGEDRAFITKVRAAKIKLKCTDEFLQTSARRFHEQGWLRTSSKQAWQTLRTVFRR